MEKQGQRDFLKNSGDITECFYVVRKETLLRIP